jgi:hypothetical protein
VILAFIARSRLVLAGVGAVVCTTPAAPAAAQPAAQFLQRQPKLFGSDSLGNPHQGWSVALSSDGITAIVGGFGDNNGIGCAWVWIKTAAGWVQQGPKLVGSGGSGVSGQGSAVALSADGNTAIVGGSQDDNAVGAAWIWTRSGGAWTQQGPKLVGSGFEGSSEQGTSVALSADGNTALVGAWRDNNYAGAVWVWGRAGGIWTQEGVKLVASSAIGNARQGYSVAVSAAGTTALVGAPLDDFSGVQWVLLRWAPP